MNNTGENGINWTRNGSEADKAFYFVVNGAKVYPSYSYGRATGNPLRCLHP